MSGIVKLRSNNCFCKERCVECENWFDADLDVIYQDDDGYLCYTCGWKKYQDQKVFVFR